MTVHAIDDHRLACRDLPPPFGNMVGRAMLRRREHPAISIERCRSPHVENQRRRRAVEQIEKITGRYRIRAVHTRALLAWAKLAQRLDGFRLMGCLHYPGGLSSELAAALQPRATGANAAARQFRITGVMRLYRSKAR